MIDGYCTSAILYQRVGQESSRVGKEMPWVPEQQGNSSLTGGESAALDRAISDNDILPEILFENKTIISLFK